MVVASLYFLSLKNCIETGKIINEDLPSCIIEIYKDILSCIMFVDNNIIYYNQMYAAYHGKTNVLQFISDTKSKVIAEYNVESVLLNQAILGVHIDTIKYLLNKVDPKNYISIFSSILYASNKVDNRSKCQQEIRSFFIEKLGIEVIENIERNIEHEHKTADVIVSLLSTDFHDWGPEWTIEDEFF